jgi:hypothetical protein
MCRRRIPGKFVREPELPLDRDQVGHHQCGRVWLAAPFAGCRPAAAPASL